LRELKIIECDNGFVLSYKYRETEDKEETYLIPIEDTGDERDCLKRMLIKVAEYFGEDYNKFRPDNIEITFTRKGHKCENDKEGL